MFTRLTSLLSALALVAGCAAQSGGGRTNTNANSNLNDNQPAVQRFSLVASTVGGGDVEPSAGTFQSGEEVTLTATADDGWRFDHWEGDVLSEESVITVTVVDDTELIAFFVKLPAPPPDNDNDNQDDPGDGDQPGGSFADAALVEFDAEGRAVIRQTLARSDDVHVYDLGPMALGDMVTATCTPTSAAEELDPMMALFDADGQRVFWNDDVDLDGGDFSAFVSGLIRHDSEQHFLAVTSTDFVETTGGYQLTIEIDRGVGLPTIAGHTVVIDFDGASNVVVAGESWGTQAAFDAADIHAEFAGETETLKQMILAVVRADFADFDMTVLSTDDPAPAGSFTTVFIGGDDDELFGIADGLDFYNAQKSDNVIVFAQAFGFLTNDLEATGQGIGNVVSHEIGHSLGLMHTLDATELMDNSGQDLPLLEDQSFGTAPVFDFPIGFQNAPLLLTESLGPANAKRIPAPATGPRCGTCGLPMSKVAKTGQAG